MERKRTLRLSESFVRRCRPWECSPVRNRHFLDSRRASPATIRARREFPQTPDSRGDAGSRPCVPGGFGRAQRTGRDAHIWETQLCRDVGGSPRGYVPDIRQEPAEGANRAELYGVPQSVGVTPSPINVTSVFVVKEEVALELSLFDLADVATVRGNLVVVEEVYRHPAMVSNSRSQPLRVRFRSIVLRPPDRGVSGRGASSQAEKALTRESDAVSYHEGATRTRSRRAAAGSGVD